MEDKHRPMMPLLLFTLEEKVRPGCMAEYTTQTKKLLDLIRRLNLGIAFSAFGSDNGYMDYNQRIQSRCDYGPKLEAWDKVQEACLATEWGEERLKAIEWSRYSVWERSAELSYEPAHPVPDPSELQYFVWRNLRVRTEKEKAFLEIGCQIRDFLRTKGIERGYNVFRNVIGYEGPLYSAIVAGKDPGELNGLLQELGRRFTFDLLPFVPGLMSSIEKMTDFQGWAMPELSIKAK